MEPVAQRSRNRCLNFLKGIACIGVVFIHVRFPGVTGVVVSRLSQFAVPLFFMIAGYYAFGCDENVVKRRLIKILKILTVGYLIYFAWGFGTSVLKGNGLEWLASNYGWNTWVKLIVFCTPSPIPVHLWYLIAMAEVYLLWFFIVQRKKRKNFAAFSSVVVYVCCRIDNVLCYKWSWLVVSGEFCYSRIAVFFDWLFYSFKREFV